MARKQLTATQLDNIRHLIDTFEYPVKLECWIVQVLADMEAVADTLDKLDCPGQAQLLRKRVSDGTRLIKGEKNNSNEKDK